MESKTKSREWVKTAAIIFLSILLVLTFFSNTIMNRTLPEIASAEVTDGSIVAKVKGTGTVSAIGNTEIKAPGTTTVTLVKAKEGAEVSEGDVLFVLGETSEELQAAQDELDSLRYSLMRAQNSYPVNNGSIYVENAQKELDAANEALNKAQEAMSNDAHLKELNAERDKTESKLNQHTEEYNQAMNKRQEVDSVLTEAQESKELAEKAYYDNPSDADKKANWENAVKALDEAIKAQTEAYNNTSAVINLYQALQQKLDGQDETINKYKATLNENFNAAHSRKLAAETALINAIESEQSSSSTNAQASANAYIDILEIQGKIEKAEKKVAELQGGEENAVTAPVGGTVTSISTSPGSKIQKDQVLCVIEVPDLGYSMSFSCTNDQAKRIKVGDTASVSNYYWGSEITATVTSIKADPKEPQNKKLVTCTLEGDVNNGSELTVSIGKKSASYDIVVPNSAVRTDSNGTFVLAVNAKNSALGNRYFAKRVPVEVLASDDDNTALSCDLSYGDFVITTSSAPIKSGDQVRMADNG